MGSSILVSAARPVMIKDPDTLQARRPRLGGAVVFHDLTDNREK